VRVKSVSVSSLRKTSTSVASASIDVATDGTGPVTIVIEWFTGNAKGELGAQDGSQSFERSGATQYTITLDHTFGGKGCYWGVRATTNPAAATGSSWQQIQVRRCTVQ
jgi:eukaryotic-like serine/threonine-protein kinase